MPVKIAFICDEITSFNKAHDSTWAIMLAAYTRDYEIHYGLADGLGLESGSAFGHFQLLTESFFNCNINDGEHSREDDVLSQTLLDHANLIYPHQYLENNPFTKKPLDDFDYIFMRKDPPFNINYIFASNVLSFCKHAKVINNPRALRDHNEKLSILNFPDLIPATIVSKDKKDFRNFLDKHQKIVIKPLDGKGGEGIFVVDKDDKNFASIIESLSNFGSRFIMAQKYIPEIKSEGDKRIIIANGEPIGALLRVPSGSDHRGNMAAGGTISSYKPNKRDLEICTALKDFFLEHQIYFAGIDIIGDYLTEINITSPTCLQEINRLNNLAGKESLESQLLDKIIESK